MRNTKCLTGLAAVVSASLLLAATSTAWAQKAGGTGTSGGARASGGGGTGRIGATGRTGAAGTGARAGGGVSATGAIGGGTDTTVSPVTPNPTLEPPPGARGPGGPGGVLPGGGGFRQGINRGTGTGGRQGMQGDTGTSRPGTRSGTRATQRSGSANTGTNAGAEGFDDGGFDAAISSGSRSRAGTARARASARSTSQTPTDDSLGATTQSGADGSAFTDDGVPTSGSATRTRRSRVSRESRAARRAANRLFDDDATDASADGPDQITSPDIDPELPESVPSANSSSAANRISGFTGDAGSPNSNSGSNAVGGFDPRGTAQTDTDFEDRNSIPEDSEFGTADDRQRGDPDAPLFGDSDGTSDGTFGSDDSETGTSSRTTRSRRGVLGAAGSSGSQSSDSQSGGSAEDDDLEVTDGRLTTGSRTSRTSRFRGNQNLRNDLANGGRDLQRRLGLEFGTDTGNGLTVDNVTAGSLAQRAGMQVGDVISSINDQPITSIDDLSRILRRAGQTGRALLEVTRNGEQVTLTLNLRQARELANRVRGRLGSGTGAGTEVEDDDTGTDDDSTTRARTRTRRTVPSTADRSLLFD